MCRPRSVRPRLAHLSEAIPVVVVCGARQVGKTTLLRHTFPDLDYVVLDPALVCAVDRPRWLAEDTAVIPWNLL